MKKVSIFFLLFLTTVVSEAQTHFGIRGGANYSTINGISSTSEKFSWVHNFHGGIFLSTTIDDKLYFHPEVIYSPKGFIRTLPRFNTLAFKDTIQYNEESRLFYIDVPVLARLSLQNIYVEGGPLLSFLLDAHQTETRTTSKSGINEDHILKRNIAHSIEPVDIGFVFGIGYQNNLGLSFGLRYNQGFQESVAGKNWQKNMLVQFTTAYTFGFKPVHRKMVKPGGAVTDTIDYYKPRKAKKQGYQIVSKLNVKRISITKIGESDHPTIEIHFKSVGGFTPNHVIVSVSSGIEDQRTMLMTTIRNPAFPFEGTIRYNVNASIGVGSINSFIEYKITEPGNWRIQILTE